MKELVIKGDFVEVVEKTVVHTTTVEEFCKAVSSKQPMRTGILPAMCKYLQIEPQTNSMCYVIERQPGITAMLYHNNKGSRSDLREYKVSLPFIQFYVCLRKCDKGYSFLHLHMSCTKKPIMNETDLVYILPLPNIFGGGVRNVCTGEIKVSMQDPRVICEEVVSGFFAAPSNRDLGMTYPSVLGGNTDHDKALKRWEELSESNPLFGISKDIEYQKMPVGSGTFRERIAQVMGADV